ncbi:hypothetical protein T8A63_07390 [Sulfitobacter sp. OXR-159]|uniref:hypothetical protein n=1 Tax=Sulfitobacter sp. OXR-159 TaxID=3100174 RepID=UPI002AC9C15C|nr:hypothetical protein [Sulfitobacter sp. OXR-159]WPZ30779.1 hypothetical protein T8A63_06880 [Sulfitobacter sp. OXR-159]WPZ30880.1 hypothetical protein T8A63_07390 [Sulfitobacter sp. OXR-159]
MAKDIMTPDIPTIENIRGSAAALRGLPQDEPPDIDGVALKWDATVDGFIFPRRHAAKVLAALDVSSYGEASNLAREIDGAAAQVNANPSTAQAEAGNYRKGRFKWNGLDLVIETAKGGERRGIGPDGKEWSVTMPAHYGDVKLTTGADGDPLDFYMGDHPESDIVVIVNQIDLPDGAFDEHKLVLGAFDEDEALKIYEDGFSDGKGSDRIGSFTTLNVAALKEWIASADMSKPTQPVKWRSTDDKATMSDEGSLLPMHKLVDAMRDQRIWGSEYGLFSRDQWRELVSKARKRADLMGEGIAGDGARLTTRDQVNGAVGKILREQGGAITIGKKD